ncbi:MAG TPA: hypothetical protein VF375_04870 [Candidatus Limnocylindrales bacterium]
MNNVVNFSSRAGLTRTELLDDHTNLIGASLRWKRYRQWTASWLPGRCELCDAAFTEGGKPGLNSGYSILGGGPAGQDDYCWICAVCYETQRDRFCWTVLDTRGNVSEPPSLLDAAFGWMMKWPSDVQAYDATPAEDSGRAIAISPLPCRW